MKVLLTGGLGYIGSHTAVELIKEGYEVEIMDNLYNSSIEVLDKLEQITSKKIRFYKVDMCNMQDMDKMFAQGGFNAVIHFAGLKAVGESTQIPLKYYETNIGGTINLINCMQKYNVFNLIFSSSACVYSTENKPPYNENGLLNPMNPYGRTKYFIEEIIKDYVYANPKFNAIILRYFNPIGAHESGLIGENPNGIPNNLMPYITRTALGKLEKLTIFGNDYNTTDGTCIRDYIHVVDLAIGHLKALNKIESLKGVNIYNLGTGKGNSVLEVVNTFNKVCPDKVNYVIGPRRAGDSESNYANADKAYNELGFKTQKTLEEMCLSAYTFEKNNK